MLGWAVAETIGKSVFSLVVDDGSGRIVMEEGVNRGGDEIMKVRYEMWVTMVGGGLPKSCYIFHVNDRQPVRLSSKLNIGGYCHSGYPPAALYRRV